MKTVHSIVKNISKSLLIVGIQAQCKPFEQPMVVYVSDTVIWRFIWLLDFALLNGGKPYSKSG